MQLNPRRDRKWLLAVAKQVAAELKPRIDGTRLRVRVPSRATDTGTDGWAATIGDLGKNQPQLAIWFDRFSGSPEGSRTMIRWLSPSRLVILHFYSDGVTPHSPGLLTK